MRAKRSISSLAERFWLHVQKPGNPDECWLWQCRSDPNTDTGRYGSISDEDRRGLKPHRVSWLLHFGPIPTGEYVRRSCRNSRCVNPKHLYLVQDGLARRFWEKVDRNGPTQAHVPHLGNCWTWTGYLMPEGYGQVALPHNQGAALSHQIAWQLTHGAIPEGLWVLHKCDNRVCVRPDHLFLGTHQDNMADMDAKGRRPRGESAPWSKLTEDQVRTIRTLSATGVNVDDIAE